MAALLSQRRDNNDKPRKIYDIYYILEFIVVLHGFLFIILAFCFNNRSPKFKLLDKEASRKAI